MSPYRVVVLSLSIALGACGGDERGATTTGAPDPDDAKTDGGDETGDDGSSGGANTSGEPTGGDEQDTGDDGPAPPPPDEGDAECHACLLQQCSDEFSACEALADCGGHIVCIEGGGSPGQCYSPCAVLGFPVFEQLYECSLARCPDECPEWGA